MRQARGWFGAGGRGGALTPSEAWLPLCLAVLLVAGPAAAQSGPAGFALPTDPGAGTRVFLRKGCVQCHSVGGQGRRIGPDLSRATAGSRVTDIVAAMWNHVPSMQRQMAVFDIQPPTFRAEEIGALIGFLYSLGTRRPWQGDPDRGRALFTGRGCGGCHRVAGVGRGRTALDLLSRRLTPVATATALWNHRRPVASARARGLSLPPVEPQEMADLVSFLHAAATVPPSAPRFERPGDAGAGSRVFAQAGCASCHRGAGSAPDLERAPLSRDAHALVAELWNHVVGGDTPGEAGALSAERTADLFAYLYSLASLGGPGDARRGARLFENNHCLECHRFGGTRETLGPDLLQSPARKTLVDGLAALWNHSAKMLQTMQEARVPWPRLRGRDVADLLAYVRQAAPESER